ncbi:MAG: hypothetical protein AAF518_03235 [Spirochaetota bacterium]
MRRLLLAILFLIFLFSGFGFISWSIIRIKLKELKYFVAKDQLLNLKLSSEVLRDKFKQLLLYKEDYKKELELSVRDSNIMNSENRLDITLDRWDYSGLAIVNGVRRISFKPPLTFDQDKELLIKLQYAFYFERVHKYPKAAKKYEDLEPVFKASKSEELGFILLHQGFCLGLLEETDKALKKLYETEKRFPGTHYATSARVLIELLLEGRRKKQEIAKKSYSPEEKIIQLYSNGFYREALKEIKKLKATRVTRPLRYIRGRSLEETGQMPTAIKEYLDLTVENDVVAQKANRRLAMIGNIYQKSEKLADYAKDKAVELGDEEMVQQVESKATQIQEAKVLQKIKILAKENQDKDLAEELVAEDIVNDKEITAIITKNVTQAKQRQYVIDLQSYKMKVVLADDRSIEGKTMNYENSTVLVKAGDFSINVQEYMISEISVFREKNKKGKRSKPFMTVTMKDGSKKKAFKIKVVDDSFTIIGSRNETPYKPNQVKSIIAGQ